MLNQKGFTPTIILLAVILFLGFSTLYYFNKANVNTNHAQTSYTTDQSTPSDAFSNDICKENGISMDKDKIYKKYTVKKGDTLLSVARDQLNDVSRVSDLIYINHNQYPSLSLDKPFLEVGWTLYLPPDYFKHVQIMGTVVQLLYQASGPIVKMAPNGNWFIKLDDRNTEYPVTLNSETQFFGKERNQYKVGDCIKVIMQEQDQKVFAIYSQ